MLKKFLANIYCDKNFKTKKPPTIQLSVAWVCLQLIITYQADYLVHEELNGVHAVEHKVGKLSCRPMSLTSYG